MKNLLILLAIIGSSASAQPARFQNAFKEEFNEPTSPYFRYGSTGQALSFKYAQGIPSPTEPKRNILSLKINPDEAAGAGKGPEIISTEFTHFGTYSARIKVPAVTTLQPNVGAVVGYFTYHVDSIPGLSEIDIEWLIADPTVIYIGTWTGHTGALQRIGPDDQPGQRPNLYHGAQGQLRWPAHVANGAAEPARNAGPCARLRCLGSVLHVRASTGTPTLCAGGCFTP